ncbi:hypothetical protein T01_3285 [Trichinella spiralis]|uniref:Uncharacterized protein n=1 Tax=Trichinella spiralis TaxID=6334 RepID=A0A0V1BB10_TRISP|nr:hypothetical protein T01_3285 [Trichinella spiralis]
MHFAYLLQIKQLAFIRQLSALGRTRRNSAGASTSNWLIAAAAAVAVAAVHPFRFSVALLRPSEKLLGRFPFLLAWRGEEFSSRSWKTLSSCCCGNGSR